MYKCIGGSYGQHILDVQITLENGNIDGAVACGKGPVAAWIDRCF